MNNHRCAQKTWRQNNGGSIGKHQGHHDQVFDWLRLFVDDYKVVFLSCQLAADGMRKREKWLFTKTRLKRTERGVETSGRWKIWQRWRIQSYQSSSGPMTAQAPIRMERCQFSIWKCGWEKKSVNSKYASSHTGNAWHHLTELYRKNIIESALAASDKKVLEDRFGLKPLYRSNDWKKSQVISTEGALRLPTTYDNHPIQPNPSHCYFGCSWGFEELHWKVEFLNTFVGF